MGERVVSYCSRELGKQVGSGECADLASKALRYAGAAGQHPPDWPQPGDYVWGQPVYSAEYANGKIVERPGASARLKVLPGDIVQFRNATLQADGYKLMNAHHTSVIAKVGNKGIDWVLYDQNSAERRFVVTNTISLTGLQSGYLIVYQPQSLSR